MSHIEKTTVFDMDKFTLPRRLWRRHVTPFSEILNHKYLGSGTKEDPFLVEWLPSDPENALTWGDLYKWMTTAQVSSATLSVALASSAYSGAVASINEQFPSKQVVITLVISLFVLGFAFGPLFWAPFSEVVGRRKLFIITYLFFTMWQGVTIASKNIESMLVFRFLSGFFGASPLVNSGGTLADMFHANQRGLAMAVFASAPFLGPALGPIIGGFIGENAGWKWVIGFLTIFAGVITAIGALTLPETYAPVLLRWRAQTLSKATGKHYICKFDKGKDLRLTTLFSVALGRPWKLLFWEPIVSILSVYIAIIYGILYSLFGAFPIVFQRLRGWSPGVGGLAFLGVLVGMFIAIAYVIFYENPRYIRIAKQHGGIAPPEVRLPPCMIGAVSIVVGLAIFAATDSPDIHWIAPIIAGGPFGLGMVLIFLSLMNYLTDSYLIYAASVLAANSVIRSLFGFAFPLFTPDMYRIGGASGIHWGPAIGGFLALICLPFPFVFAKYGAQIRAKCKYSSEAAAFLAQLQNSNQPAEKKEEVEEDFAKNGYKRNAVDDLEADRSNAQPHDLEETSRTPSRHDSANSHSSSEDEEHVRRA